MALDGMDLTVHVHSRHTLLCPRGRMLDVGAGEYSSGGLLVSPKALG